MNMTYYPSGYRPRVRCWIDHRDQVHIAGEPRGLEALLDAVRVVLRGLRRRAQALLISQPIPSGRNPTRTRMVRMFSCLTVRAGSSGRPNIVIRGVDDHVVVTCTQAGLIELYVLLSEAGDGEWGLSCECWIRKNDTGLLGSKICFWGFSGKNSF